MNKTLLMTGLAALPVFAQGEMPKTKDIPVPAPGMEQPRHWGADGEMPGRPNRADFHKKMLEKYDADKDGRLSDAEKEAMKAEMQNHRAEANNRHGVRGDFNPAAPQGRRPGMGEGKRPSREEMQKKMLEKFDADKDGQLSDAEKEAMKAARPKRPGRGHGEGRGPKGMHRPQGENAPATLPL